MRHDIRPEEHGPLGLPMAEAVESCVHCGFCLPTCPTYQVLEQEMDSPRGRIVIMKEVLEGTLELELASEHLDACLGCLACFTACPSGVEYGELITAFRGTMESGRRRPLLDRLARSVILGTLPHPGRFRAAASVGRLAKPLRPLLPGKFRGMLDLLPDRIPPRARLQERYPARGETRARVALLAGCAQQVLSPGINLATIHVLTANGVEVLVPPAQGCCGALAAHTGALDDARAAARRNLNAFDLEVDAIVTNAAGCGSGMKEYGLWLRGDSEAGRAESLAARTRDVTVFLSELGPLPPEHALEAPLRVAYHDACHLSHGQGVTTEPRALLRAIPGIELLELSDPAICCGSAGTYNIEQPDVAAELGRRKADSVRAVRPDVLVSGNIGCITQLAAHLRADGVPVMHTMELLARVYDTAGA